MKMMVKFGMLAGMGLMVAGCVETGSRGGMAAVAVGSGGAGWKAGVATWSLQYEGKIVPRGKDYHIVDMFDVSDADLALLRGQGTRTVAYFSSQYEDWRNDAGRFPKEDLGKSLDGWEGERWVNTKSEAVREVMRKRLDLAKRRGFYGVDIDNVDFYAFETGFDNSTSAAVDYIRFLSREARARGLKFGLKNAVDLIPSVRGAVDYYVNEQAHEYDEVSVYRNVGKPVFNLEYRRISRGTPWMYTVYKRGAVMDAREEVVLP